MAQLFEPLLPAELEDRDLAAVTKRAAREAWRRADAATEYWKTQIDHLGAARRYFALVLRDDAAADAAEDERWQAVKKWRRALAAQLLTPACIRDHVAWKKKQRGEIPFLPISALEIEASIARDVAALEDAS